MNGFNLVSQEQVLKEQLIIPKIFGKEILKRTVELLVLNRPGSNFAKSSKIKRNITFFGQPKINKSKIVEDFQLETANKSFR